MNHCHRCNSDYEKPGTCNCYAPHVAQPWPWWQPSPYFVPYPPAYPYTPYVPFVPTNPTIIWGNNDAPGVTTTNLASEHIENTSSTTGGVLVVGNTTGVDPKVPWSYTH